MGHTDTLINVLKSGKLEQPETLLRDLTQTKEKYARFIYVFFFFVWLECFFKDNSNSYRWNKIFESFGLSAGPILAFIELLMRHAYVIGQCTRDVWRCWIV